LTGEALKIGLVSPWNDCCGVAVHAWLVGSAWLRMGHELVVFAPIDERLKGRLPVDAPDEPFVIRCWEMYQHGDRLEDDGILGLYLDPRPLLEEDFDVLFVEKPCSTPLGKLMKLMHWLKRKGPVVAVMHAGIVPRLRSFYRAEWDAAALFDERFYRLYGHVIKARRLAIIPYPFHPVKVGDKEVARRELGLPSDVEIVLAFGVRAKHLWPLMPYIAHLAERRDLKLLILAEHGEGLKHALALRKRYDFVEVRREAPHYEALYAYLHASDAVVLHRPPADYVPISSTVHLCLGAMRPLLCPDNNFFEVYDGAVVKYSGPEDFAEKLEAVLDGDTLVDEALRKAKLMVDENRPEKIAEELLELALDGVGDVSSGVNVGTLARASRAV